MNNNPNENVNQQASATTVTPNVEPVKSNSTVSVTQTVPTVTPTSNSVAASTPVVTSGSAPQAGTTSAVTSGSAAPTPPAQTSGPVPPQQDRIQLIDDKPKLHAVMSNDGKVVSTEEKHEDTEVLDVVADSSLPPEEKKGGKARTFLLVLFFGGLLAMIIFLPDISNYIETQKYLKNQESEPTITTGILKCNLETNTANMDYSHDLDFSFKDSKLTGLTFVTETRGDINLDEKALELLKSECDQLATGAEQLSGITVSCDMEDGVLTKKQVFDYDSIVVDDAITAYIEAGGIYPDYENGKSIDTIEREMNAQGYTCERIK